MVFFLYAFAAFLPEGKSVNMGLKTEYVENKSAKPTPANFSYHKSCYIITLKQWNGGPYWSRAFPLISVERYLSSSLIKGLTKSQIAGYINDIEDKTELLDHLIDNKVPVIAESIDKSRVRSIRSTNAQAKLTGWDIVFSEYYIATHI